MSIVQVRSAHGARYMQLATVYLATLAIFANPNLSSSRVAAHSYHHHDFEDMHHLVGARLALEPSSDRYKRAATSTSSSTTTTTTAKPQSSSTSSSTTTTTTKLPHLSSTTSTSSTVKPPAAPTAAAARLSGNSPVPYSVVVTTKRLSSGFYAARDVAYFLEGHQAMGVHDPRAYFTDERTSRSLAIMLHELPNVPKNLRFAFVARVFHELGRKIASKLNRYHAEVYSLLTRDADGLGSRPEVSSYLDVISRAFESKEDREQKPDPLAELLGALTQMSSPAPSMRPRGGNSPADDGELPRIKRQAAESDKPDGKTRRNKKEDNKSGKKAEASPQSGAKLSAPKLERKTNGKTLGDFKNAKDIQRDPLAYLKLAGLGNINATTLEEIKRLGAFRPWPWWSSRTTTSTARPAPRVTSGSIKRLLEADPHKAAVWNASLNEISIRLAHTMSFFVVNATKANLLPAPANTGDRERVASVLGDALRDGARVMLDQLQRSDAFAVHEEMVQFMDTILRRTLVVLKLHLRTSDDKADAATLKEFGAPQTRSFRDLNPISHENAAVGPWNSLLFERLGSAERVVKLFASLLLRVPLDSKSRYISAHLGHVMEEFGRTMPGFVALQSSPHDDKPSELYLLNPNESVAIAPGQTIKVRDSYAADKNRLPARCYLAGRRWRHLLMRALKGYAQTDDVISSFVNRIVLLKAGALAGGGGGGGASSSSDPERLCLPRLEMGLKGWGINGEPPSDASAVANKFPLRNPIEGLNMDEDPFTSGARMGYRLGFMIGYNEKRNASLELESVPRGGGGDGDGGHVAGVSVGLRFDINLPWLKNILDSLLDPRRRPRPPRTTTESPVRPRSTSRRPTDVPSDVRDIIVRNSAYLAKAGYWHGMLVGARRALDIACREGYMATLKVSLRAGMLLPLEAGSHLASIKASNFAAQVAGEAGRQLVNKYLMGRDGLDEQTRRQLVELGGAHGSLAGHTIGDVLGAIVGREAALEAYRRAISRGGKMARAKFHLDEYCAGATVGFEHGVYEGGRVALAPGLDSTAPREFKFTKPRFSAMVSQAFGELDENSQKVKAAGDTSAPVKPGVRSNEGHERSAQDKPGGSRSALIGETSPTGSTSSSSPMDRWEKDLITPLTPEMVERFHAARNHTRILGSLNGSYTVSREVKRGMQSVSYSNKTYLLNVQAIGFVMNDVAYLSLSGTIENANVLRGSLVAKGITLGVTK